MKLFSQVAAILALAALAVMMYTKFIPSTASSVQNSLPHLAQMILGWFISFTVTYFLVAGFISLAGPAGAVLGKKMVTFYFVFMGKLFDEATKALKGPEKKKKGTSSKKKEVKEEDDEDDD